MSAHDTRGPATGTADPDRPGHGTPAPPPPDEREAGPRWLWFAVLGGVVAWVVHLFSAWMLVELGCPQANHVVLGIGLRSATVVATVVPAVVAAAALAVALAAVRALRSAVPRRRSRRAFFMAEVGAWLNALALLMIVFGGVAVATLGVCAR
jgi:hypothetical protein